LATENISPHRILAVTFTNKAAGEMRGRIETLLKRPAQGMWVGTFHGLAHRLLRAHWQEANLPENFQILDSEDQLRLIKRVLKNLALDDNEWPPKQAQHFINSQKEEGIRPQHMEARHDRFWRTQQQIYQQYEEACHRGGLVDFAELLLRAHELWLNRPAVLSHYQDRFKYILVDEFQDTNRIQYAWLRVLAGNNIPMMAVGDDDQSIYGWRGARVENLQQFLKDYKGSRIVKLEQNYRSTSNILKAANSLISNNDGRLGKQLWTEGREGEPIALYAGFNEQDEARFIVERIAQWVSIGNKRNETAILYRSNAQSRALEEALVRAGMAYRIYGGVRFYERMEIKNAVAYLRLLANRDDDAAFERVVNTPTRGIGEKSLEDVRATARAQQISLWKATVNLIAQKVLTARAATTLQAFIDLINKMDADTQDVQLHEKTDHVIQTSGLITFYKNEKGEKGQGRIENLQELVSDTKRFALDNPDESKAAQLNAFLAQAALDAGEAQADAFEDCVQLMTLHSAKGLEFPLVFLAGCEEGIFPNARTLDEPGRLEEERRLCYVGITRAMQKLYITFAEHTFTFGIGLHTFILLLSYKIKTCLY
jgi:DNA helicase-2/ATP-dependent DNA helicase PcrA